MNSRKVLVRGVVILGIVSLVFLAGCGGGTAATNDPPPPDPLKAITVSVSPANASVQIGMSQQFTAIVQNDPANRGVTWIIGNGTCQPADCGTIDTTGKYTAPPSPHYASGLVITATSVADPSKTGTAVVFVTPAPTGIAVLPGNATLQANSAQQFSAAAVPFAALAIVTWSISGSGCTVASCGTIDSTGKYNAPVIFPNPPLLTVTATSVTNPSVSGSAVVFLGSNPNNVKLNGQYAFLFSGFDGDGFMQVAGSFTTDGRGNITGGTEDVSRVLGVQTGVTFTGTYSVGADDRGAATLSTSPFMSLSTFSFALGEFNAGVAGRGRLTHFYADEVSTGVLAKQDRTAFLPSAISGGYAFGFAGMGSTGNYLLAADGRFTAAGGSLSAGEIDINDGGRAAPVLQFTGTYSTIDANGRAIAALTISDQPLSNFVFYVVSGGEMLWMQLDDRGNSSSPAIGGTALRQSGGPYSMRSLNGAGVLNLSAGCDTVVAQQSFDGNGNFEGILDEQSLGSDVCGDLAVTTSGVLISASPFTGTYRVDNDGFGRGVFNVRGDQKFYPFYLVSPGKGFIIDGSARAGMFEPQIGGPFSNGSLSGGYFLGTLPLPMNWSAAPSSGKLTANGSGSLNGITDGGASAQSFTGTYSVAANGRTNLVITSSAGPSNWIFYLISPSKAVGIQVDAGGADSGVRIIAK